MVESLEELIDDFPGAANQTRCFLHILNLVVKSILKQFDLPKKKKASHNNDEIDKDIDKGLDQAVEELLKLAGDLEGDLMADGEGEHQEKHFCPD